MAPLVYPVLDNLSADNIPDSAQRIHQTVAPAAGKLLTDWVVRICNFAHFCPYTQYFADIAEVLLVAHRRTGNSELVEARKYFELVEALTH